MSPYIFVLVMNVFSSMLDFAAANGIIRYHPKCKRISLTQLCFVDDLLIFSKGDLHSVIGVQKVLKEFYRYSSLMLNANKSEIYCTNISEEELHLMQEGTGFKLGKLPISYLGIPLVTSKYAEKDFDPLVQKMRSKVESLGTKQLSYACRIQLVQIVLFALQVYWCKHFFNSCEGD